MPKAFAFGQNWRNFEKQATEQKITLSIEFLKRLLPDQDWRNTTFIDIGSGSGLSSVAARRLGATVSAMDVDPDSVEASIQMFARFNVQCSVKLKSVFDVDSEVDGTYGVVYSWGVLHHTGEMWGAIRAASKLVEPSGLFVIALYKKTRWDRFWIFEKQLYSRSGPAVQFLLRVPYKALYLLRKLTQGENPIRYIREYGAKNRGMSWHNDVHDWLGGWPYESVTKDEIVKFMADQGFELVRDFVQEPGRFDGLLGSGCDEYVFQRI